MSQATYQVMPDLSPDDFEALKTDISARGVLVPVEYDEEHNVLDGHHRIRACNELGIKTWPKVVRIGLTEDEKRTHARQLNLARRQLNRDQKQQLIREQLKETPELSDRQIASSLGVKHDTVGKQRKELESCGQIGHVETSIDTLGRQQPRNRKPKPIKYRYEADSKEDREAIKKSASALNKKRSDDTKSNKTADLKIENLPPNIRSGDFKKVLSDVFDIDLIVTDPPYGKEYLGLWEDLAIYASDHLSKNGVLCAYSGQMYLPQVFSALSKHLDYWWTLSVVHAGSGNLTPLGHPVRKVINQWKPVLFFSKRNGSFNRVFRDIVPSSVPDKSNHNWSQSKSEFKWIIDNFSEPGDLVVDPFCGGGTALRACENRKFIGAEILKDG